jgi:hypothetical protein
MELLFSQAGTRKQTEAPGREVFCYCPTDGLAVYAKQLLAKCAYRSRQEE